jgi:hypothetical protein
MRLVSAIFLRIAASLPRLRPLHPELFWRIRRWTTPGAADLQVFAGDIEYALQNLKEPLILDEAQTLPDLFPVLRSVIDEARRKNGRFFLLALTSPT